MTVGDFYYLDPSTVVDGVKPWAKVDGNFTSFETVPKPMTVHNVRDQPTSHFGTDVSGFALHHSPSAVTDFSSDAAVRGAYYDEITALVRDKLPGASRVVIFDHTIRRMGSAREPVQRVHVDQTPQAAEARVRRHMPAEDVDGLLKGRWQILNAWRPIRHKASDMPLAFIDWRSVSDEDLRKVDLMYPKRPEGDTSNDDRGKETRADPATGKSTEGYEPRGEIFYVTHNEKHKWHYVKDMAPEEVLLFKMYDSWSQGQPQGRDGVAALTPHTAFKDPETPADAPGRESIEVRILVFYD